MFASKSVNFMQKHLSRIELIRHYRPRKPMWLGTAKSKLLRVPEIPQIPEADLIELKKLYNNYRTALKSIKRYCRNEYYLKETAIENKRTAESDANSEEVNQLLEENQKENERVAKIREGIMSTLVQEQQEQLEDEFLRYTEQREQQQKASEKKIEEYKIAVKSYITTEEQLDEAIEKALANPVDYTSFLTPDEPLTKEMRKVKIK